MPCPFKIFSTNNVNTVCGGVQVTGFPGLHYQGPRYQISWPRVASPKAQCVSSRVPGSQVSGSQGPGSQSFGTWDLESQGPGSQVVILDFFILSVHTIRKHIKITFRIYTAIC